MYETFFEVDKSFMTKEGNEELDKYSDEKVFAFFDKIFSQPLEKAKRRFYFKPYQDFDYRALKWRDVKLVIKYFLLKKFQKKTMKKV